MHINIWENLWNQHVLRYAIQIHIYYTLRLNFEKELKSTVGLSIKNYTNKNVGLNLLTFCCANMRTRLPGQW